jgi:hypothetical protein
MCTVTYVPTKNGFELTSSRDEHVSRGIADPPAIYRSGKHKLMYPKDPDKKGSWFAAKDNGDIAVLLNGAFVKHGKRQSYLKSRGLVLIDIIKSDRPEEFYKTAILSDIEPFTLILYSSGDLFECRWDGGKKHFVRLDNQQSHIWSSATLYDKRAADQRKDWFYRWLGNNGLNPISNMTDFHINGGAGDPENGLIINRGGIMRTMSITNIKSTGESLIMSYIDLKKDKLSTQELPILSAVRKYPVIIIPPSLRLKSFLIRLFRWEYWPFNVVYSPILFYWFWLSLKARSFFFFSTANPSIKNSGFAMESKNAIYEIIPKEYFPQTVLFEIGTAVEDIAKMLNDRGFSFPYILKPDIGGRGTQVKLVHNEDELKAYVLQIKVDFLVQKFIPFKNEVGIFYYRIPGEATGHISGIVGKEFLTVKGDGSSTIKELIISEPRYLLQLPVLVEEYGIQLNEILPQGETKVLVPYGNHARGAKFIDLSNLITEELSQSMDKVCQRIPDFYFGRLDVMYDTWEALSRGEDFAIVELNGAGSEPTHIYDSSHSLLFAWGEIIRHWKLLYLIGRINKRHRKLKYMTYKEGVAMLKQNTEYLKLVS